MSRERLHFLAVSHVPNLDGLVDRAAGNLCAVGRTEGKAIDCGGVTFALALFFAVSGVPVFHELVVAARDDQVAFRRDGDGLHNILMPLLDSAFLSAFLDVPDAERFVSRS